MPNATQAHRRLNVFTPLGTDVFLLTRMTGADEISRLFEYRLELLSEDAGIQPADIVGMNVGVSILQDDGSPRWFNGFVSEFSAGELTSTGRFRHYRLTLVPWMWFLTRTSDCRIFQNRTVPEIIEQIFQDLGFSDFEIGRLRGDYPSRTYCVQYRESDHDFVCRLMEEEGLFFFFRHEDDRHVAVIGDDHAAYRPCPAWSVSFERTTNLQLPDVITGWERKFTFRSGKWAHTDYNFEKPRANLMSAEATVIDTQKDRRFEVYDYPGRFEDRQQGERLVRIRMESEELSHNVIDGTSTCLSFTPACTFRLMDYEVASDNEKTYLITAVRHEAVEPATYETESESNGQEHAQEFQYRNRFQCIPETRVFRAPAVTRKPIVEGPQTAIVVGPPGEEIYPDEFGRVKVQFHWDREGRFNDDSSCWIRVSQVHAGKGWGSIDLPRIGEEVIVEFLEGDPDRPIITGRVYNGDNQPPFALPAGMTRSGMKSNTHKGSGYNEFSMDDTAGSEQIRINGQYNMDTAVGNNQTLVIGVDRTSEIGNNDALTVGNDSAESVGNNKSVTVANDMNIQVGNKFVLNAGSSITLKCGASKLTMNSGGVITLSGTIITTAAAASASVVAPMTQVIGGVMLTTVGGINMLQGATTLVDAAALASVSGAKVDVAGGTTSIKGAPIKLN
jgi:type VI secretion system secreted protein VgrG